MRLPYIILCTWAALAVLAAPAVAEETAAPPVVSTAMPDYAYPLSKFFPQKGPVRLNGADGGADLYFPMSGRLHPREALLSLEFTNSVALLPQRSVLSVLLNGTTIGQIHLDPIKPRGSAQITLPVDLLQPGYNRLSFVAAQHYAMECEDPESPELWTEIDAHKSTLSIKGDLPADAPRLSQLDDIFSPGMGGIHDLDIITGPGELDDAAFKAGALVAEGVALRRQYEGVSFHSAKDPTAGDHALVGTTKQLASYLPPAWLNAVTGPTLAIQQMPGASPHLRLVVTGRTPEEMLLAAKAFSIVDFPFTDAPQMLVSQIHPASDRLPAMARQYLAAGERYTFADLGQKTTTLRYTGTHAIPLDVNMPPDLYGPEQATVDLHLDLAYGAGMGPGSVVNLMLNGNFERAIHLNNIQGDVYHDYVMHLPLRSFHGGSNHIGFEVVMGPESAGHCMERNGSHLIFSLADTSSLVMPAVGHYTSQPDLGLFGRTGFPYISPDEIKNSVLAVLDPSLAASGWTLAGKLAQVAKAPLDGLNYTVGWPKNAQQAIVIGPVQKLPADLFAQVDYGVGAMNKVPYLTLQHPKGEKEPSLFMESLNSIGGKGAIHPQADGYILQANDLGRNTVMLGMASPSGGQGTLTLITARDADTLAKGIDNLVQPGFWPLLSGTLAVWRDNAESFASIDLGGKYSIGENDPLLGLRYRVSHWPAEWIAGSIGGVVGLAWVTVLLLRRRSKRKGRE